MAYISTIGKQAFSIGAIRKLFVLICIALVFVYQYLSLDKSVSDSEHLELAHTLSYLAILFFTVPIAQGIFTRLGQSQALGYLSIGLIISSLNLLDIHLSQQMLRNEAIQTLKLLGQIIILFDAGLEANLTEMRGRTVLQSLSVALIGVVTPLIVGTFVLGPWLRPNDPFVSHLSLGSSLVATSVAITKATLDEINVRRILRTLIIVAAVFDDVLGLITLDSNAKINQGIEVGWFEITMMVVRSLLFIGGSVALGHYFIAPWVSKLFSKIHSGYGMKLGLALSFAFFYSWLAVELGYEAILGAFTAGLVLDDVHFKVFQPHESLVKMGLLASLLGGQHKRQAEQLIEQTRKHEVADLIKTVAQITVPTFFITTGLSLDMTLITWETLGTGLLISVFAIVTKVVAGFAAPGTRIDKLFVGIGMVPRGEVGLIFAAKALEMLAITPEVYAIILVVVIITSFVAPPILKFVSAYASQEEVNNNQQPKLHSA